MIYSSCMHCGKEFRYPQYPAPLHCANHDYLEFSEGRDYFYYFGMSESENALALREWLDNDFLDICEEVRNRCRNIENP